MNILVVNWQDVRNPQAGGAEIHLFEIFTRLVQRGHRVRLVCCNWVGGDAQEVVRGIEVHRVGGRHSVALKARAAVRRALAAEAADVVCEDVNKLPLFLAGMVRLSMRRSSPAAPGTMTTSTGMPSAAACDACV